MVPAMDASILVVLLVVVAAAALIGGRSGIAKGTNSAAGNGALLMAIGTIAGVVAAIVIMDM